MTPAKDYDDEIPDIDPASEYEKLAQGDEKWPILNVYMKNKFRANHGKSKH